MSKVTVMVKEVGKAVVAKEVEDTNETWKGIVGGWLENYNMGHIDSDLKHVDMMLNEEGKLMNLAPNLIVPQDVIVGDVVFVHTNYDEDGTIGNLTVGEQLFISLFCLVASF